MKKTFLNLCLIGNFLNCLSTADIYASAIDDSSPHSITDSELEFLTSSPSTSCSSSSLSPCSSYISPRSRSTTPSPRSVSFADMVDDLRPMLKAFEAYLSGGEKVRSRSFRHINDTYEVNLAGDHLEVRGPNARPFLEAYPLAKRVSLAGVDQVPLELLSPDLEELNLYGCDLVLDNAFITQLGTHKSLNSLVIVGKRYFPLIVSDAYKNNFSKCVDYGHEPLRPTFTTLAPLSGLKALRLETMKFTHLPEDISCLSHLETLKLRNNYDLSELPTKMRALTKLTTLDLTDTHIHALPEWITDMRSLSELYVGYIDDVLAQIPDESHTMGLVHEATYRGMPANLTFDLPKGFVKKMQGLIIHMNAHAAMPYLESPLSAGLVTIDEAGIYQVPLRKKHRTLSYIAKSIRGK